MTSTLSVFLAGATAIALVTAPAQAQSSEQFYKDKTINLLIGFGVGGGNDSWSRAVARHIGKHLPGKPNVVPQNVPGAGGLKLANQLYNVSPKDGTVFGLINRGIPFEPLLGGRGTQFDAQKFNWIGSPDRDVTVCAARKDAPVTKMADLFSKELVMGATGSGADSAIYPEFLAELVGMKFKVVKGYKGSNDIMLAMERKEVQGVCLANDSIDRSTLARQGQINKLFQAALVADPGLKDVPVARDIARSDTERQALELFFARVKVGRPFVAPPGVPADRVAALRNAFDATVKDPEFIADAKKQRLIVEPISGREIAEVIAAAYRTPPDVVKKAAEAVGRVIKARAKDKGKGKKSEH